MKVNIVGGGMAGCEAAYQLAKRGIKVNLFEMRLGEKTSFAHKTDKLAELVCSNSFRNDDVNSAIGLLHAEMRLLDSLIIKTADKHRIPAGSALAVDRDHFSADIEENIMSNPNITVIRKEIEELPVNSNEKWIIATGPLTSDKLSQSILKYSGEDQLSFFDAIAPVIYFDSIDFSKAWMQSRYDKGSGKDYINCPLTKEQYFEFVNDLNEGEKTQFKEWEKFPPSKEGGGQTSDSEYGAREVKPTPYFEGCLPIEVMAERGVETLRFGPLKPVGLTNSHDPKTKPYGVVQLRQDNKAGTIYNMVGFQTKLKYQEQQRIFRKIPGLEKAEFARFGGIHRNSFINSPKLLDSKLNLKKFPHIKIAGQISGVEGYVESASMGLLAGIFTSTEILNKEISAPPASSAIGSLLNYITFDHYSDNEKFSFQPMNVNFGIFAPLEEKTRKTDRKEAYSKRALQDIKMWQY